MHLRANPQSMYVLGDDFYFGRNGKTKDFLTAKSYYEKVLEIKPNHGNALYSLGWMYEHGQGCTVNFVSAARFYRKAIEAGYSSAQDDLQRLYSYEHISGKDSNSIAVMYSNGEGVNVNHERAWTWLTKAKEKKEGAAYRNMGFFYENGFYVAKNLTAAAKHYQLAIELGYAEAQDDLDRLLNLSELSSNSLNEIGVMFHNGDEVKVNHLMASTCYIKAKNKGESISFRNLGILEGYGLGIQRNFVNAAKNFQEAMARGYSKAKVDLDDLLAKPEITAEELNRIGILFHDGENLGQSFEIAKTCYQKAQEKDLPVAYRNLGFLYEFGLGVKTDMVTALKQYQQAIDKGYVEAQKDLDRLTNKSINDAECNNIGVYYHNRKDYTKAIQWYMKAKQEGSNVAYRNLGSIYEDGLGVPRDFVLAAKYYQQSYEKGFSGALDDLKRLLKSPDISADDLNRIGVMYYSGDGVKVNYDNARLWQLQAKEKGSVKALYNLGVLEEEGLGIPVNLENAAKYYQQAADKGFANEGMTRIFNNPKTNYLAIGKMYHYGESVNQNFEEARKWYKASYDLPWYKTGTNNLSKTKKQLKELEKDQISKRVNDADQYLKEKDGNNDTPLHRAAKYGLTKTCARFMLLGANKDALDRSNLKPLNYLPNSKHTAMNDLQRQISCLSAQLSY